MTDRRARVEVALHDGANMQVAAQIVEAGTTWLWELLVPIQVSAVSVNLPDEQFVPPDALSLDDLTADVDTCMTCVGLALGAAAAVVSDEDTTAAMVAILNEWPAIVPDAALAVGMRATLAIANALNINAGTLGTIAATLLDTDDTDTGGTTDE